MEIPAIVGGGLVVNWGRYRYRIYRKRCYGSNRKTA